MNGTEMLRAKERAYQARQTDKVLKYQEYARTGSIPTLDYLLYETVLDFYGYKRAKGREYDARQAVAMIRPLDDPSEAP